jgi:Uma2 family endonuclease
MNIITSLSQLDFNGRYNYGDYLAWKIQERVELLKGRLSKMAAPSATHQEISTNLNGLLWTFFRKKPCKVYAAPFDVRLSLPAERTDEEGIDTVVQPDLCVICDLAKITKRGCNGAPDLVIEILSPGNSSKEMREKFGIYEQAGVREYWIIDPDRRMVLRHVWEAGKFRAVLPYLTGEEVLSSAVFEGLSIDLNEVFPPQTL